MAKINPIVIVGIIAVLVIVGVAGFMLLPSGPSSVEPINQVPVEQPQAKVEQKPREPADVQPRPADAGDAPDAPKAQIDPAALSAAKGTLDGTTTELDEVYWVIVGQWTLDCGVFGCIEPDAMEEISFTMTHNMAKPDGANAHSHTYTNFIPATVTLFRDAIVLEGTITGSGPIGTTPITIRLDVVKNQVTIELENNDHLQGEIEGIINRLG